MKIISAALTASLLAGLSFAGEIDILQQRLVDEYKGGSSSSASSYLGSQRTDGSWSDIDYANTSINSWTPLNHLRRVRQMAISYVKSPDAAMLSGISRGLQYWYTRKPVSNNWWYNDIAQQQELGPTLLLIEPYISESLIDQGCALLNDPEHTGQNLVWMATETVWRGCLKESIEDITLGMTAIKGEVKIADGDGIQTDGGFYQHARILYNGGYGEGFAKDCSYWAYMTRGLDLGFEQAKLDILSFYLVGGTFWMIRKGYIDYACLGRGLTVSNSMSAGGFKTPVSRMTSLDTVRKADLALMSAHLNGVNDGALTGDKHFWRNDYHVTRGTHYMISTKMTSKRTRASEHLLNDNYKGYYLSFGTNTILVDGHEYHDIFPVWDWTRLPGLTAPAKNPMPEMPNSIGGTTDFVGGVSNGKGGMAAMDLSYDGMMGKKAWFSFDGGVTALGAGLSYSGSEELRTSVNQCLTSGSVTVSYDAGSGSTVGTGQQTLISPKWVYHDKVGYVFPNSGNVLLKNQNQSGTWKSIRETGSSSTVTKSVFSLWFSHGTSPAAGTYAYSVYPGSAAEVQSFANAGEISILSNTTAVQAVRHTGQQLAGIAFHQAGQLQVRSGLTVKADKPCFVLVDESSGTPEVSVAEPTGTESSVTVDLIGPDVQLVFTLRSDVYGGQTVTKMLPGATNDKTKPVVTRVSTVAGNNKVFIEFSKTVDATSAQVTGNYSLNGPSVSEAEVIADGKTVRLTVSAMTVNNIYNLQVSGVKDQANPGNTITTVTKSFKYYKAYVDDFDRHRLTWTNRTAERWSLDSDGGDVSYHLNTSSYGSNGGDLPGEWAILQGIETGAFEISAQIKCDEPERNVSPDYGFFFGYEDDNNQFYFLTNRISGLNQLFRVKEGIRYEILNVHESLIFDEEYHELKFRVEPGWIHLYQDGVNKASIRVNVPKGKVGLCSYNDMAWFDDFVLIPYDGVSMGIADMIRPLGISTMDETMYTLDGRRVERLRLGRGVYLGKSGNGLRKLIILE